MTSIVANSRRAEVGLRRLAAAHPIKAVAFYAVIVVAGLLAVVAGGGGESGGLGGLGPGGSGRPGEAGSGPSASGSLSGGGFTKGGSDPSIPDGAWKDNLPEGQNNEPGGHFVQGNLPLEVSLNRSCATPATPMLASVKTTPGAAITLAVAYRNGQTYGQFGTFRAGPDGTFRYPWTVPAAAPRGIARFLLGATDQSREESAAGYWNFMVAPAGGC